MAFEHRENSGTLFINDRKKTEKHPDWKGEGLIGGVPMWISAWVKDGKRGEFLSLSFEPKEPQGQTAQSRPQPAQPQGTTARPLPRPGVAQPPPAQRQAEPETAEEQDLPF